MTDSDMCHAASVAIEAPDEFVFDHLADPVHLGRWALGCMDIRPTDDRDVFRGNSLFDGGDAYVEIRTQRPLGLIDYFVGGPQTRAPRIFARIAPGALCGLPDTHSAVSLIAWRQAGMSQQRWQQLCRSHEVEILLIKAQIETRFRGI